MSEREKMIEAINSVQAYGIMSNAFGGDLPVTNEMLADALISAGIGDVKETDLRAEVAERAFSKLVHEMYEHGIRPMCDEKFFVESRLKDAEKELAEEEEDDIRRI